MCKYCKLDDNGTMEDAEYLAQEFCLGKDDRPIVSMSVVLKGSVLEPRLFSGIYYGTNIDIISSECPVNFCPMCGRDLHKNVKSL